MIDVVDLLGSFTIMLVENLKNTPKKPLLGPMYGEDIVDAMVDRSASMDQTALSSDRENG
jgi:hypothetical protein